MFFEKCTQVFEIDGEDDDDQVWEALDRMRNLVESLKKMLKAVLPDTALQRKFKAFRLPSPLAEALTVK